MTHTMFRAGNQIRALTQSSVITRDKIYVCEEDASSTKYPSLFEKNGYTILIRDDAGNLVDYMAKDFELVFTEPSKPAKRRKLVI